MAIKTIAPTLTQTLFVERVGAALEELSIGKSSLRWLMTQRTSRWSLRSALYRGLNLGRAGDGSLYRVVGGHHVNQRLRHAIIGFRRARQRDRVTNDQRHAVAVELELGFGHRRLENNFGAVADHSLLPLHDVAI